MGACDLLRMVGIVSHFVCVILFLVGMGTINWTNVKYFQGEAGLWQYCNLQTNQSASEFHGNETMSQWSSRSPSPTSTTPVPVHREEDNDDDEDECHSFGVIHIDGYLHIVRLIVIGALFCFAYGFCKGTTIRVKIEYDPRFVRQHLGELLSLVGDGTLLPYLKGLRGPNGEKDGDLLELGWSAGLLRGAALALIPAVILMMMPTLNERFGWCDSISSRQRSRRPEFNFDRVLNRIRGLVRSESTTQPARSDTEMASRQAELTMRRHSVASTVSGGSRYEPDGNIFTITDAPRRGDNSEPAPRYEDLAPLPSTAPLPPPPPDDNALMPPPPSYDDVLKGMYATTPPNGSSTLPPPPYTDSPPPVLSSSAPNTSARPDSPDSSSLVLDTFSPFPLPDNSPDEDNLTTSRASSSSSSTSINETNSSSVYLPTSRSASPVSVTTSRSRSPT